MANPGHGLSEPFFVAALWRDVQPVVSADENVQPAAVNRRYWNIQNTQIDGQLAAMVIVVIHEDRSNESDPRNGHQYPSIFRQAPSGHETGVVHFLQRFLGGRKTLGESGRDFLAALGLPLWKA